MKLTSELLTGVYEKSEELKRLDAVVEHGEVLEDLQVLSTKIKGCMALIDDLNLAYESLHSAGYSTEWFDIINKDNNFMAVVDLDMPKFFGGDETKQAACEGAIIETIKKWAKAVWEWIKSFFDKVRKALYWIKGLWVHQSSNSSAAIQTFDLVCDMAKKSPNPQVAAAYKACFADLLCPNPDVVIGFLKGYRGLMEVCREINDQLDPSNPKNAGGGPSTPAGALFTKWEAEQHSFGRLVLDKWGEKNVPPRNKVPVLDKEGISFTGNQGPNDEAIDSIIFAAVLGDPGCKIPKFEMGYSQFDAPKQQYWFKKMGEASSEALKLSLDIKGHLDVIEKNKKNIEKIKNQLISNVHVADDSPEVLALEQPLKLFSALCLVIGKISTNCTKLSARIDSEMRTVYTRMEALKRDLKPDA